MAAQLLYVLDQVGRGVVHQAAQRARASGAALVEDHDAPERRVEEAAMHSPCPGAWAAMQEQHGLSARVAHLLPIHDMPAGHGHVAGFKRSDFRKKITTTRHDAMVSRQPSGRNMNEGILAQCFAYGSD